MCFQRGVCSDSCGESAANEAKYEPEKEPQLFRSLPQAAVCLVEIVRREDVDSEPRIDVGPTSEHFGRCDSFG